MPKRVSRDHCFSWRRQFCLHFLARQAVTKSGPLSGQNSGPAVTCWVSTIWIGIGFFWKLLWPFWYFFVGHVGGKGDLRAKMESIGTFLGPSRASKCVPLGPLWGEPFFKQNRFKTLVFVEEDEMSTCPVGCLFLWTKTSGHFLASGKCFDTLVFIE